MKDLIHKLYKLVGHILCRILLVYWKIRDRVSPPKSDSVLFVSHPDDDTLFFHTFIKKYKPYVVLMTTGWSLKRVPCFIRVMRKYGVRFRIYDLEARDTRIELLKKHVREVKKLHGFTLCATHNEEGEYGHEMHVRVHDAVTEIMDCRILCPVKADEITLYPLEKAEADEKTAIFNNEYTTELFVLDQYKDWVVNECLEEFKK